MTEKQDPSFSSSRPALFRHRQGDSQAKSWGAHGDADAGSGWSWSESRPRGGAASSRGQAWGRHQQDWDDPWNAGKHGNVSSAKAWVDETWDAGRHGNSNSAKVQGRGQDAQKGWQKSWQDSWQSDAWQDASWEEAWSSTPAKWSNSGWPETGGHGGAYGLAAASKDKEWQHQATARATDDPLFKKDPWEHKVQGAGSWHGRYTDANSWNTAPEDSQGYSRSTRPPARPLAVQRPAAPAEGLEEENPWGDLS
mmetsp:Transcript_71114/g.154565  ORF Transcript_71114/g.154565 Transcript_71114/m.154565 type:complete len:252 (-) Transcript_71114:13-768(-)